MRFIVCLVVLVAVLALSCTSRQKTRADAEINLTGFIDTVQRYSQPHPQSIRLDTLIAEHFPAIPFPFFSTYYARHLDADLYDWSVPPTSAVYWRFSFLTSEQGKRHDYQRIIGYSEEKGTYLYLVTLDKTSHAVMAVEALAYAGGDGPYYETDLLTRNSAESYTNLHTIGEADETSLNKDSTRTDLLIQTIRLTVQPDGRLRADTVSARQAVEKQYNEAKQQSD